MIQDKIFFDEKDPTGLSYNTPFTFYGSYQGRLWSKAPGGEIKYYTQNSDLSVYAITGSNQFNGNQAITGSLTVTGGIIGTTATSSYVEYSNVANKPTLVSGSSQVSFSGITNKPTLVSGSAQVSFSGITNKPTLVSSSVQVKEYNVFATTGSNGFNGSQSITGSLTVTGQVVAQTLNVQQVTSSIVYSSGSNIFGNSLSNTQQFTGSVGVTGSLTVNGTSAVVGSGTTNYLSKFTAGSTIGNSQIFDNGTTVFVNATTAPSLGSPEFFVKMGTANTYEGILVASSTNNNVIAIAHTGTQGIITTNFGASGANTPLAFGTNGAGQMTLDTSGNLGLGVTPNTWAGTAVKAFQFQNGSLAASNTFGTWLSWNAYYDGVNKYVTNSAAGRYLIEGNVHRWDNAPSGTAGNAISFTQAMTLDASGRLGIGAPSPSTKLHIVDNFDPEDALGYLLVENTNTTSGNQATNSALNVKNYHGTSQFMQWEENGMRIGSRILTNGGVGDIYLTAGADSVAMILKAGGNVLIGTSDDIGYKLNVNGSLRFSTGQTGGYLRRDSGFVNETANVGENATAYFLYKYSGDANGSSTTTFNITGLSNNNGTWADINLRVRKDATASAINTVAYIQIHGNDMIGPVFASGTGAVQTNRTIRVVRMTDEWIIIGGVGSY